MTDLWWRQDDQNCVTKFRQAYKSKYQYINNYFGDRSCWICASLSRWLFGKIGFWLLSCCARNILLKDRAIQWLLVRNISSWCFFTFYNSVSWSLWQTKFVHICQFTVYYTESVAWIPMHYTKHYGDSICLGMQQSIPHILQDISMPLEQKWKSYYSSDSDKCLRNMSKLNTWSHWNLMIKL